METVLSVLEVIIAVFVVFLVLMPSGKDSGLSGAFGVGSGAGPLGGGSLVERNLNRWTIFFAILFFVNAVVLLKRPWAEPPGRVLTRTGRRPRCAGRRRVCPRDGRGSRSPQRAAARRSP